MRIDRLKGLGASLGGVSSCTRLCEIESQHRIGVSPLYLLIGSSPPLKNAAVQVLMLPCVLYFRGKDPCSLTSLSLLAVWTDDSIAGKVRSGPPPAWHLRLGAWPSHSRFSVRFYHARMDASRCCWTRDVDGIFDTRSNHWHSADVVRDHWFAVNTTVLLRFLHDVGVVNETGTALDEISWLFSVDTHFG